MEKVTNIEDGLSIIKKTYKPGISIPILMSFIGLVMYWGIWMDISDSNYNRIILLVTITALVMIIIGGAWTAYYFRMQQYKKEVRDFKKSPESYEW